MTEPKQPAFKGSCACGRITYSCAVAPHPRAPTACHCITCRKLSGGAYQAFAHVPHNSLTWSDQTEHLHYEGLPRDSLGGIVYLRFSDVADRAFCASCYSPLAMRYKDDKFLVSVCLGTVDEDSVRDARTRGRLRVREHMFVSQKARWAETGDEELPKHERFVGGKEKEVPGLEEHGEKAEA